MANSHDSNYYLYIYITVEITFSIYQLLILFLIFLLKFNRVFLFLTLRFFFFSSYSIKILLLRKPETFSFLFLFLVAEMFHKYQFFLTLVKIFPLPLGFYNRHIIYRREKFIVTKRGNNLFSTSRNARNEKG